MTCVVAGIVDPMTTVVDAADGVEMMVLGATTLVSTVDDSAGIDETKVAVVITDGDADGTELAIMAEVEIGMKDVAED